MSALALACVLTGALAVLTLASAATVRLGDWWRARWEAPARARLVDAVALFCVEVEDELPSPAGRRDRRLLREAMLEAAAELSGAARERLAVRFAALGFRADASRELGARSYLVRVRAAEALGELGGPAGAEALRGALHDREPLVRVACAKALTRSDARGLLAELFVALSGRDDAVARGARTEVLLDAGPPAVDELLALLDGPLDPSVRRLVLIVLGELRAIDAVPALLDELTAADAELRARAAHALGKVGDPRGAAPLAARAGEDPEWIVRTAAAAALGSLGEPGVAPALVAALADGRHAVRDAAARSLVALGEPALAAVAPRLAGLPSAGVAHLWGWLDVEDRTPALIDRAARGDGAAAALVAAAQAGGARARLEERAADADAPGVRYALSLLHAPPP